MPPVATEHSYRAFTSEKVCSLTGATPRQLQYWDEEGFLSPSLRRGGGKGRRRLYTFRDLVSLRVVAQLRQAGISLQLIRRVVDHLRDLDYEHPLTEIRFWAVDGELYFREAQTLRSGRRPAQSIISGTVPLAAIVEELEADIVKLERREPGKLEKRRGTLGSKLLIAGTRIPVASVQRLRDDGADEAEILTLYPDLTPADVRAALAVEAPSRRSRAI
jgi:DNA-binding transcriptional MerR regulator